MKAWTPLILIIALATAVLLNNRETKPVVVPVTPIPAQVVKKAEPVSQNIPDTDDNENEVATQETPAAIAQPEAQLQPQPPEPALPVWNIPQPKPRDDMWTLRETVRADMSDRSVLLITYGKIPKPNFRIENWEPSIFVSDDR